MMSVQNQKSITPIGSCRITQPLRKVQAAYDFNLNKSGVYGYSHSSSEAVQMAQVLLGQMDIPDHIWPLISKNERPEVPHAVSDIYVVELSSAKLITLDGWSIQLNYLTSRYPALFGSTGAAREYWRLVDAADQQATRQFLDARRIPDAGLLSRVQRAFSDRHSLSEDMGKLVDLLPQVVFVTHVNARQPNASQITTRASFILEVEDCAADLGATLYNPTRSMRIVGQAQALSDDQTGLAHYTDDFEKVVGRELAEQAGLPAVASDLDDPIMQAAAHWVSAAELSKSLIERVAASNLEQAAGGLLELIKSGTARATPGLEQHLDPTDTLILRALERNETLGDVSALTDGQIAEAVEVLRARLDTQTLDRILLQLGRAVSPDLSRALGRFLGASFRNRQDLLEATNVVLKHAPTHAKARAILHHIEIWLKGQDLGAATSEQLQEWSDLHAKLPKPSAGFELALARAYFNREEYAQALKIGASLQDRASENLTLLVMLMRAANRCSDKRATDFAQQVIALSKPGSNFAKQAQDILQLPHVGV